MRATTSRATTQFAHELAERFERCLATVAATHQDDALPEGVRRFADWLAAHWVPGPPRRRPTLPVAVSRDGQGTVVLCWTASRRGVVGWVPGMDGQYAVDGTEAIVC